MDRKKCYETPLILKMCVELEDGVCNTASVMREADSKVEAASHETGFDNSGVTEDNKGFSQSDWE